MWKGSPPRGRGKDGRIWKVPVSEGITPAWAGKSLPAVIAAALAVDHPRVGGEKTVEYGKFQFQRGSPPRGRGKARSYAQLHDEPGITPAWAGKRRPLFGPCAGRGDHPRVGGEKLRFPVVSTRELGSPPRGRGKADKKTSTRTAFRITPAWAGKSIILRLDVKGNRDHPRVGGEKLNFLHSCV